MATAKQVDEEVEALTVAFHVALTQLGLATAEQALTEWAKVPPVRSVASGSAWLARAVRVALNRNRMGRDISFAYYRLVRALRTGETIQTPDHPERETTLEELRDDFAALVEDFVPPTIKLKPVEKKAVQDTTSNRSGGGTKVKAVPIKGLDKNWILKEEKAVEDEAKLVLRSLGSEGMWNRLEKTVKDDIPVKQADETRKEAHRQSGARQAAASDRIAMNGGRGVLHEISRADKKVIGYVRVSTTGTPCGFCAMLISRGVHEYRGKQRTVFYKSEDSALRTYAGDEYHDNCHCIAVPVFSLAHYKTSGTFALNREYASMWPKVTKGYGGKDALSEWRRYFRELADKNDGPTQEARAA